MTKPDTAQSRRHHISMGLKKALKDGLIRNFHVRDLAYAHCYEAKVGPPAAFFGDTNAATVCATLVHVFGGKVSDPQGYAAINLTKAMKHPYHAATFASLLASMEKDGLVVRKMHTGGRKTDEVRITAKGLRLIGAPPYDAIEFWLPGYEPGGRWNKRRVPKPVGTVQHAVAQPQVTEPVIIEDPLPGFDAAEDMLSLQRLCLSLADDRVTLQSNIDVLIGRLTEAHDEIERLRNGQAELVHGDDLTIAKRITDEERSTLRHLMSEIPRG